MTGKPVHSMIRVLDEVRATEFYRRAFGSSRQIVSHLTISR